MTMRKLSLVVFLILCLLYVAHVIWYYPQLPDRVASHFSFSGQPDAWSTKTFFVTFYLVITGGCALLFIGVSFGMSKIPVSLINLPNKDYWLSEDHKQQTFDFMSHYLLWFASATLLFFLDMFHQSVLVALGKTDSLPHPMLSLGIYIGFIIVWSIGLLVKFGKKGKSQQMHAEVQS